ncbi:phosphatidylserine/phosphatidylglycerophosphate/cardiolipin synthase [Desulfosporosinus orientis DSM 765]|uniref:Phosphatidylserine/phosphatidylglycerophosphate/ cardiolipin synthase n=1 Tax=Desulfosporosinus orientis (strain ATCC 19365 / DSM 765 / NCIMB 8382 / VKM B-1628 / Singapore I) TaxID=768706 RepID=G7WCZ4_DESOD|nr:phospholipase D family protein [Desulfosporosinus orientis]AET67189.1 phosphatidylserine/phosphatidylglycerophosphate/cardiolipin synthase [Desulfosporosinus orientis DSM 765]
MPSLDELREKWFLDFNNPVQSFPPVARHPGSQIQAYTDGNLVTPLIDGKNYMDEWRDAAQELEAKPAGELYHSAYVLNRVLPKGAEYFDAFQTLKSVESSGKPVRIAISGHASDYVGNKLAQSILNDEGIPLIAMDFRYPSSGSNHMKFTCYKNPDQPKALLGSIDITFNRWDKPSHEGIDPERPDGASATHDAGVMIEGPAVADLETTFIERWNDNTRSLFMSPVETMPINAALSAPSPAGSHSVQVLRTYGIAPRGLLESYSWSEQGEFTIWAAYLNAIKKASKYIYIEDQYFFPFEWPPCYDRTGKTQESDLFFQLAEAIKRGVKVIVVVPGASEDAGPIRFQQKYQRDMGVYYLKTAKDSAEAKANGGDFVIVCLSKNFSPIYVHSKLMICDDEFVLIGSANFNQRSMTHDGELQVGILDRDNRFAKDLRMQLWGEHMELNMNDPGVLATLEDSQLAYLGFKLSPGRVIQYTPEPLPFDPLRFSSHELLNNKLIDPYAGPSR